LKVGFYDDPAFREHEAGAGHPERPARLDAVERGLASAGLLERLQRLRPREATRAELERVHAATHVERVAATEGRGARFDADTSAGPRSYRAALLAAGAAVEAVDRILDGGLDRAFCAVRPPGHHAEADRAMGFCLFNNVAVAAAHALARGLTRVLVLDPDVHHGNGTQAIFESDPRVLYVSTHQFPFYPGTGSLAEVGTGAGRGFTVNLPMPAGCGDAEYAAVYREIVEPIGAAFDPQLVLVSQGFDPHADDPLAGMRLTPAGFAAVMGSCLRAAAGAAQGRVVVTLEGGYDLQGIAESAAAVVGVLLGDGIDAPREPSPQPLVGLYRQRLAPFWPVLAR
jgi:acetoin utilization deacetylase AcuC-like enzyme